MSFYDDDKYDDDLSYDDDDYEDEVEEEDENDKKDSSLRSRINPYSGSGGGLPGRDRAAGPSSGGLGSRPPASSGSRDDLSSRLRNSSSPIGGGSSGGSSSGGSSSFYNRPSGSSGTSGSASGNSGSGSSSSNSSGSGFGGDRPRPFSTGSSGSGSSGTGGARPFSSGSGGSSSSGSGTPGSNPPRTFGGGTPGSSGGSGSNSSFGNRPTFGSPKLEDKPAEEKKPDDKKPDDKSVASNPPNRFGGFGSRIGGDKLTDDKKPDDKKPDDKPTGGSIGGRLGGLAGGITSRVGGGDKPQDAKKPDEKKPDDKSSSPLGGIGGRLGGLAGGITSRVGGGDKPQDVKKPDEKKPDDKPTGGALGGRLGGLTGGIAGRFGGDKPAENKPADKPAATSATPAAGAPPSGPRFGSAFGSRPSATPPASSGDKPATPKGQSAATPAPSPKEAVQNFFSGLTKKLPIGFGSAEEKKVPKPGSKTKATKVPQAAGEGMSLDTKLDILGVALVFGALLLFLSALSPQQGAITGEINRIINQLLGWGANAVPLTMIAIGGWLIARHFGDEAPKVDPMRVIGVVMLYVTLLILFQYAESFNAIYKGSFELYNLLSPNTIAAGRGGGQVGWQLYSVLVQNVTEIGGAVIALGLLVISIMFITRTSAAELAVILISVYRSFQLSMQRRTQRRAAARLAAEQATPIAPPVPQISVSKPAVAELPAPIPAPTALPAPIPMSLPETAPQPVPVAVEDRPITIRMGGQTLNGNDPAPAPMTRVPPPTMPKTAPNPAAPAASKTEDGAAGRIAGRLRQAVPGALPWGGNKSEDGEKKPEGEKKEEGTGLRGMFGRRPETPAHSPVPPPARTDAPATPIGLPKPTNPFARPATTPPGVTPPGVTPAAASAASAATPVADTPPEDFFKPAQPKGIIPPTPTGTGDGTSVVEAKSQEEKAAPEPVPPTAPASVPAPENTLPQPNRVDRLNELRQGVLTPKPPMEEARPASFDPARPRPFTPSTPISGDGKTADGASSETPKPAQPAASAAPTPPPAVGPAVSEAPKVVLPSAPSAVPGQPEPQQPTLQRVKRSYNVPEFRTLLSPGSEQDFDRESLVKKARIIEDTLTSFGAPGRVVEINTGPVITQFGIEPGYLTSRGGNKNRIKVSAIAQLDKDLQLALGARSIRVEAPVPGKGYVGVEVPNDKPATVSLRDVMESKEFTRIKSPLGIGLGQSVDGAPVAADLTSMPHLLIAGTTGSGKSVCVNAIIASLLLKNSPDQVKFIMVDPKRVELTGYNGIPHLIAPVVVELERIVGVLKWVTREMDERYKKFSNAGARNIEDYNKHLNGSEDPLPYIVVIIDELADLMMLAPEETERTITRIAALARATGIHLVIATQRPSVDVVTGLIKANFPARIAFAVAGSVDSRVILDQPGAERLLGRGDMLYMSGDAPAPLRLQGVYVSDTEINNIVRYWRSQQADSAPQRPISALVMDDEPSETARAVAGAFPSRSFGTFQTSAAPAASTSSGQAFWDQDNEDDDDIGGGSNGNGGDDGEDEMYEEAVEMVRRLGKASVSLLQRRLRIGYTRAARLIDIMEERGVVGPATEGSKPRDVLK
jgi:DNA segregation ATPase FtsK/SpoIIIE, S-DNA-T family